ncbi:MAG: PIN domain-containing protein [Oscillospiraceae bacterium]|nr:PIN domain-containing protein [Oscillospiraceae bacterium]
MDKVEKRYMFDTNAINKICQNPNDEITIYKSKINGYEYYFTEIQCQESCANIIKKSEGLDSCLVERQRAEYALNLLRVIPKLQTCYVGQIATLRLNRWGSDGTFDILQDNESEAAAMFSDILNDNDRQYYNDSMIALTAIVNGCTLVTNDKRLFNKVNNHFIERAIKYENFIEIISE